MLTRTSLGKSACSFACSKPILVVRPDNLELSCGRRTVELGLLELGAASLENGDGLWRVGEFLQLICIRIEF